MKPDQKTLQKMIKMAKTAQKNAYVPYSGFQVGTAILSKRGKVFSGANVENAAYKGICAEGSAISAMVTAGEKKISAILIVGPDNKSVTPPCGDCRQRISEFADDATKIYCVSRDAKQIQIFTRDELLPHSFGPRNLAEAKKLKKRKK